MREEKRMFLHLAGWFVFLGIFTLGSDGLGTVGDSEYHYLLSRYAWTYPHHFLDLWGKPFFTLMSSPFSHLGYRGMQTFNIGCSLLAALCMWRYLRWLEVPLRPLSLVLLFLMPVYLRHVPTGLTEPLFGLCLVWAAWWYARDRLMASSILISFLPFVRSEGFLILPLFALVLAGKKRFKHIAFLAVGFLAYAVVGLLVYRDSLWMFRHNPYELASTLYGHGTPWHFVVRAPFIFGLPVAILAPLGAVWLARKILDRTTPRRADMAVFATLVTGSTVVYFVAHVIFWWRGIYGSLGLTRVMAGIAPCAVLTAMVGLEPIAVRLEKRRLALTAVVLLVVGAAIAGAAYRVGFPVEPTQEERMVARAATWLREQGLDQRKIYCFTGLARQLGKDPFDRSAFGGAADLDRAIPHTGIPEGSLIVWDAHYGPNEGGLPLAHLARDPELARLRSFVPSPPFPTLNGYPYEIHVFVRNGLPDRSSGP